MRYDNDRAICVVNDRKEVETMPEFNQPSKGPIITPEKAEGIVPEKAEGITPEKAEGIVPEKVEGVVPEKYENSPSWLDDDNSLGSYVGEDISDITWGQGESGDRGTDTSRTPNGVVDEGMTSPDGSDTMPNTNGLMGNPSLNPNQLEGASADEQVAFVKNLLSEKSMMTDGVATAIRLDELGLDMSKRNPLTGSYEVPLQGVLYAETVKLGLMDRNTGNVNPTRLEDLVSQKNLSEEDNIALKDVFDLNHVLSKSCEENALFKSEGKRKELDDMFSHMDEAKDFEWVRDIPANLFSKDPEAEAGMEAIRQASAKDGVASDFDVKISSKDMMQADMYKDLMNVAKAGKLTPEMASEAMAELGVLTSGYHDPQTLGMTQGRFRENLEQGVKEQSEQYSDKFVDLEHGKFGPLQRNGAGFVLDLPGVRDLHIGKTKENQESGRMFGMVDNLDNLIYPEDADMKANTLEQNGEAPKPEQLTPSNGDTKHVFGTTPDFVESKDPAKKAPSNRGAEAEAQFGDLLRKQEAMQFNQQMGE